MIDTMEQSDSVQANTTDIIKQHIAGLNYISETDSEWQVWVCAGLGPRVLNTKTFLELVAGLSCENAPFDSWFDATIRSQGISQGKLVRMRYTALRDALIKTLDPRYVFKVKIGSHRFAYYAVGIDSENNLLGCVAEAVET